MNLTEYYDSLVGSPINHDNGLHLYRVIKFLRVIDKLKMYAAADAMNVYTFLTQTYLPAGVDEWLLDKEYR